MGNSTKLRSKYPQAFKKCIPEALQYGKCVAQSIELKAKECDKEFTSLNRCFQDAVKSKAK